MSSKLNAGLSTVPVYAAGISEYGYMVTDVKGTMTKAVPFTFVVELQKVDPAALVVGYAPCKLYAPHHIIAVGDVLQFGQPRTNS
jgi:hypothetical protein